MHCEFDEDELRALCFQYESDIFQAVWLCLYYWSNILENIANGSRQLQINVAVLGWLAY